MKNMKKHLILPMIMFSLLIGCTTTTTQENILLPDSVIMKYEVIYGKNTVQKNIPKLVTQIDSQIQEKLVDKMNKTIENLVNSINSHQVIVYDPTAHFREEFIFQSDSLSHKDICARMDSKTIQDAVWSEIQGIKFIESWSMDSTNYSINKNVMGWIPIRYFSPNDTLQKSIFKKKIFVVKNKVEKEKILLVENLITFLEFQPYGSETEEQGFDLLKMSSQVLEGIKAKKLITYSVGKNFSIDKSKPIELDSLFKKDPSYVIDYAKKFGKHHLFRNHLFKIAFCENWYYHPNSFSITKEVMAFGMTTGDNKTQVLCWIVPQNK